MYEKIRKNLNEFLRRIMDDFFNFSASKESIERATYYYFHNDTDKKNVSKITQLH